MCIICFLEDVTQSRMRKYAQGRNDRFEDTLKTYKDDFLFRYKNFGNINNCTYHKNLPKPLKVWATKLEKALPNKNRINSYFDSIIEVYVDWLKQSKNIDKEIEKIFKKTGFESRNAELSENLLFRARISDILLSKEDLYHIPFNKRYLVGNQRYSVSGIPMMYFGLSIPDVVSEMRGNYTDLSKYCFAGYFLKEKSKLNIFDFTNPFPSLFSIIKNLIDNKISVEWNARGFNPNKQDCIKAFYLFILYSCCSFNRRNRSEGNVFSEEYVLPQLVTKFIYNKGFDGIAFESTRVNDEMVYSKESYYHNTHKLNYVLFTKYQAGKNYDYDLLDKFYIAEPLKVDSYMEVTDEELETVHQDIIAISKQKHVFLSLIKLAKYTGTSTENSFSKVFIKENENDIQYWEHPMGKLHRYLLYSFLLTIRNEI